MNRCQGCTECCRALGVAALNKKVGEPCPHTVAGKGCALYRTGQPTECGGYNCEWLIRQWPQQWRPDVIGAVLEIQKTKVGRTLIVREKFLVESGAVQELVESLMRNAPLPVFRIWPGGRYTMHISPDMHPAWELWQALRQKAAGNVSLIPGAHEVKPQDSASLPALEEPQST